MYIDVSVYPDLDNPPGMLKTPEDRPTTCPCRFLKGHAFPNPS